MKKRVIVNLSTPQYKYGQERLVASLQGRYEGDVIVYQSEHEVGSPFHQHNPYAFKIYAIQAMMAMGYEQVLWLDASCYAVKNVEPIFDFITEKGYFFEEAGHLVGQWSNEFALNYFGITREQAMWMPMFSAGFTGLDFTNEVGVQFFEKWRESMLAGAFKGSWENHRHDMTCGSIIAFLMGLKYNEGGKYFAYIGESYGTPKETVIFNLESGTN